MTRILAAVFSAFLVSSCMSHQRSAFVGVYHRAWFHSDTVLTLGATGEYSLISATLQGDDIQGNREVGVWTRTSGGLVLHPTSNSYAVEFDGLRELIFSVENEKDFFDASFGKR